MSVYYGLFAIVVKLTTQSADIFIILLLTVI